MFLYFADFNLNLKSACVLALPLKELWYLWPESFSLDFIAQISSTSFPMTLGVFICAN